MSKSRLDKKHSTGSANITQGTRSKQIDLVSLVTNSIRERILDGTHPAGSTLPAQGELALTYNVSRNVIREAMRDLQSLGMVEVSQGRYPQVKHIDTEASVNAFSIMLAHCDGSMWHIMESRVPLEIQVATLAAERATPEDLKKISHAMDVMEETDDPQTLSECDQAFHCSLARAAGNPLLQTMVDTLSGLQCQFMQEAHQREGITRAAISEHHRIFEAVENHDEKAAGQAMLQHLEAVLRRLPKRPQDDSKP
ncbi:MAG: FadR family transcriptional regulator [Pirellulales bacterium]|nr:FadR family transcriptional regulator [Pirellulales bacterium]